MQIVSQPISGLLFLIAIAIALAGCGGSSPSPSPPVNPSWRGAVSSQSSWAITQGSFPGPLANGSFDFRPGDPSTTYLSYVEVPLPVSLYGASTYSLTYEFTGDPATFLCTSCAAGTPVTVRLLLHQVGDTMSGLGAYAFYRWFSAPQFLAAGTNTITVPIGDISQWVPVYASDTASEGRGYVGALQHLGSVGVCFGGGDFACHGVSGSGHFQINGATIQ